MLLAARSSFVVCIDVEPGAPGTRSRERLEVVQADASYLPLRSGCCGIATFIFTLHEIDPRSHRKTISEAKRVANHVAIVEPSPNGARPYELFRQTWNKAMRSIGRFEEYKTRKYWANLLSEAGLQVVLSRVISWRTNVPKEVLRNIVTEAVNQWKELGIDREYIKDLERILSIDQEFKWSDIIMLIGYKNR